MEMFRSAIDDDKAEVIDFGIGNDGYKKDWMSDARPLYALTAYDLLSPRGLAGIVRSAVSKLVGRVRSGYAAPQQGLQGE
jgi:CelD/BcsL family acetyltransferase involved in cellulose biosynthesis